MDITQLANAIKRIKFSPTPRHVTKLLIPQGLFKGFREGFYHGIYVREDVLLSPDLIYKGYNDGTFEFIRIKRK